MPARMIAWNKIGGKPVQAAGGDRRSATSVLAMCAP
jgi:hypothetical protein